MAHCCPSSSFGTSRRGWSLWWGRRIRWRRATKRREEDEDEDEDVEEEEYERQGEKERERGDEEECLENRWNQSTVRYDTVAARRGGTISALSAVNGAHVVDGLLSHPLLVFRLGQIDSSTPPMLLS